MEKQGGVEIYRNEKSFNTSLHCDEIGLPVGRTNLRYNCKFIAKPRPAQFQLSFGWAEIIAKLSPAHPIFS